MAKTKSIVGSLTNEYPSPDDSRTACEDVPNSRVGFPKASVWYPLLAGVDLAKRRDSEYVLVFEGTDSGDSFFGFCGGGDTDWAEE